MAADTTGADRTDTLADAVAGCALLLTIISGLGIVLAALHGRHRPTTRDAMDDATAAAGIGHTIARPTPARV